MCQGVRLFVSRPVIVVIKDYLIPIIQWLNGSEKVYGTIHLQFNWRLLCVLSFNIGMATFMVVHITYYGYLNTHRNLTQLKKHTSRSVCQKSTRLIVLFKLTGIIIWVIKLLLRHGLINVNVLHGGNKTNPYFSHVLLITYSSLFPQLL